MTSNDRGVVLNAFPIRYFDPGTGKVKHPDAGPNVLAPPITTPPLKWARHDRSGRLVRPICG